MAKTSQMMLTADFNLHYLDSGGRSKLHYFLYLALVLLMLAGLGWVWFWPKPAAAFASGSAQIETSDPALKVVYYQASTNDPLLSLDPGQEKDVARCSVRLVEETALVIKIYSGYPGYHCTLSVLLENHGQQVARLDQLFIDAPFELAVSGPQDTAGLTLAPGGRLAQNYYLFVKTQALEGANYRFQIVNHFSPGGD
jgi:hypothetical protein